MADESWKKKSGSEIVSIILYKPLPPPHFLKNFTFICKTLYFFSKFWIFFAKILRFWWIFERFFAKLCFSQNSAFFCKILSFICKFLLMFQNVAKNSKLAKFCYVSFFHTLKFKNFWDVFCLFVYLKKKCVA